MTGNKHRKKTLSLYIHIPFCIKKCGYCDFLSMPASDEVREAYLKTLLHEIRTEAPHYREYEIVTVFLGGGTPSVLTEGQTGRLMEAMKESFLLRPDAEITMEVNPGTVTKEKLTSYVRLGINRLSIGMQSTDNATLKKLGRIHTFEQFLDCFHLTGEAGFQNVNVDVMSALPGQTFTEYCSGLETVLALGGPLKHISAYSLILEEGTPFFERYGENGEGVREPQYRLPDEDTERRMYQATGEILEKHGFYRYEISNYALPGYECRHNERYWTRDEYAGFGIGAASLVGNRRWKNGTHMGQYLAAGGFPPKEEDMVLSVEEQMEEFMFLGLRRMQGIDRETFRQEFGTGLEEIYGKEISVLKQQGLLWEKDRIMLTKRGIDVSNYVFEKFLERH